MYERHYGINCTTAPVVDIQFNHLTQLTQIIHEISTK